MILGLLLTIYRSTNKMFAFLFLEKVEAAVPELHQSIYFLQGNTLQISKLTALCEKNPQGSYVVLTLELNTQSTAEEK